MRGVPRKGIIKLMLGCGAVLTAGVMLALVWRPAAPYRFLLGHAPFLTSITREMGGGGGGWEYQIYSWSQNYREVKGLAAADLQPLGFSKVVLRGRHDPEWQFFTNWSSVWTKGTETRVSVLAGRCDNLKDAMKMPQPDPSCVTVIVENHAPDALWTWIRLALPHQEW